MNAISPTAEAARLWTIYAGLPPAMKFLMRLRALIYTYATPAQVVECLKMARARTQAGSAWTQAHLAAAHAELLQKGLLTTGNRVVPAIEHRVTQDAFASNEAEVLVAVVQHVFPLMGGGYGYAYYSPDQKAEALLRILRLDIYANSERSFRANLATSAKNFDPGQAVRYFTRVFEKQALDESWIASRVPVIQALLLEIRLRSFLDRGSNVKEIPALAARCRQMAGEPDFASLRPLLIRYDLQSGNLAALKQALQNPGDLPADERLAFQAAVDFLEDRNPQAVTGYREALKQRRKRLGRRKLYLENEHALLFPMAMLRAADPSLQTELQTGLDLARDLSFEYAPAPDDGIGALHVLLALLQGMEAKARTTADQLDVANAPGSMGAACVALARYAVDPQPSREEMRKLATSFDSLKEAAPLVAGIYAEILAAADSTTTMYAKWLRETQRGTAIAFTRLIEVRQPWERALASLDALLGLAEAKADKAPRAAKRLVWFLDPDDRTVTVAEQSAKGASGWTDGRAVAMKRLYEQDPKLDYLTPQDRLALRAIRKESGGWGDSDTFYFDDRKVIALLPGHPAVFDARHRARRLDLVSYPVELLVTETKAGYRIALSHTAEDTDVFLEAETPERYRVIEFPKSLLPVQEILGTRGLTVPAEARDRVVEMAKRNNPLLPVRAEIAEMATGVEGQSTPVVRLLPDGEILQVSLMVRPFGPEGPVYIAGLGGRSVLAGVGGQQTRATRDLERELAERAALIAACPTLRDRLPADAHEVTIDDLDSTLELLLELRAYQGPSVLEWPEGKKMRVVPVDASKIKVKVAQERDWFGIEGSVALDEDQVLEMRFLLDRLGGARGRFVKLDDGQFIALTRQLQTQLERLASVSEPHRNGRRVHALDAPALEAVLEDAGAVKADAAWKKHIASIRSAEGWTPRLPDNLQAELRDYQVDGFVWMSRLARWGAGACLADDMGLGKTVQTIAVLLDRAAEGASLVVAPTSVCPNWESEITRFAPTLNVHRLIGGDRAAKIAALGPRDVLICSYGIFQQSAEELCATRWNMVVLDEAQAIKNAETKRAQAVGGLQAGFRLALTGTPVENYLDELWSLFSFVVPGVLGSREGFQKRFARPIERDRDPAARQGLRALIRPFLLRRTKAAVLSELPPRIEQTMHVEMEDGERVFYEALRRKSLERIEAMDAAPGQRRVQILAEITRLRRACCNPALIDPEAGITSGKLMAFMELVDELVKNRHRALVFSQFVGHLDLIRGALDKAGLRYEYLDGSTPSAEREKRVASFQAGGTDLFLISLRAGGTGLNLTAADYVVHLDPWWNPAVEDQASDRAHRIGQERPVTIYRLIMQDSIEERILALHRDKRDLASDILEGGEVAARLSEDDLLGLIRA